MSPFSSRRWMAMAMVVALLLSSAWAWANPYQGEDTGWEGYSNWLSMAAAQGLELEVGQRLDWGTIDSDDVLVVVYPDHPIDVQELAAFVSDGGRLLWLDDFGASGEWLQRLGIERSEPDEEGLPHSAFVQGERGWPIFEVSGQHPLITGVEEVVANFPAVLEHEGGAVIGYDRGGGLIYDMILGEGRAVVIADPGLFINGMMGVADNERLAQNTLNYLCEEGGCRGMMFSGAFEVEGRYGEGEESGMVEEWNRRVQEVFRELPETPWMIWVVLFLSFGGVIYLGSWFRWRRPDPMSALMDARITDISPPMTEYDWNMERFCGGKKRVNYALTAALLKEVFEGFWHEEVEDIGLNGEPEAIAGAVVARYMSAVGSEREKKTREVHALFEALDDVPRREAIFVESDPSVTGAQFDRLVRRIEKVIQWMGKKEAYERYFNEIQRPGRGSGHRR